MDPVNTLQSAGITPAEVKQMLYALSMAGGYAAVGLAAIGSAIGAGIAGCAAIGSWKRSYLMGKPAAFLLTVFAVAPLSQTIYAFVFMMLLKLNLAPDKPQMIFHLLVGIFAGAALMASAIFQGKASAAACDAFGETGKGFANDLMVVGVVETVALFAMVFAIMVL